MEKGVTEQVLFLCIIIIWIITVGAFVAHVLDFRSIVEPKKDYNIRDPTYQEALQFICSDQTDQNQYNESYTCTNFADDFLNNALSEGYRCGYVTIEFPKARHAIVCFNTSDNGLIFLEPQNDEIITVATEQQYLGSIILQLSLTW
jgi:hypothetical protein